LERARAAGLSDGDYDKFGSSITTNDQHVMTLPIKTKNHKGKGVSKNGNKN